MAFPHVSHRFTLVLAFWEAFWLVVFGFVCFGLCFVFVLFCETPHVVEMSVAFGSRVLDREGVHLPCTFWFYLAGKASPCLVDPDCVLPCCIV